MVYAVTRSDDTVVCIHSTREGAEAEASRIYSEAVKYLENPERLIVVEWFLQP